jgi:hypothetical protein
VMEAVGTSSDKGRAIDVTTRPERPAPIGENLVRRKLA